MEHHNKLTKAKSSTFTVTVEFLINLYKINNFTFSCTNWLVTWPHKVLPSAAKWKLQWNLIIMITYGTQATGSYTEVTFLQDKISNLHSTMKSKYKQQSYSPGYVILSVTATVLALNTQMLQSWKSWGRHAHVRVWVTMHHSRQLRALDFVK